MSWLLLDGARFGPPPAREAAGCWAAGPSAGGRAVGAADGRFAPRRRRRATARRPAEPR
ncbi:hypothetical protein KCH_60000 [Kitasatospora cheerisanensis KCTC 2395]|uniref:Uncharacterized protein n=1 Tax=Kitasatospora cheerisanensis KCTC 2395 TaxID=1348663 RepID=A0A066YW21_9ACTN|nr:hypothetical protein KCH_60000 [Kitasatospora cheerisanensis KCTC 2395]